MKRILVIEDDDSLRAIVKSMLCKHGYEVLEAGIGEKGLELARAHLPDLVLSDVNMAGLDGFAVLEGLRSQPDTSAIPIILMTGVPEGPGARLGMERGADDYLAKPFEMQALVAAVRARLGRQEVIEAHARANEKTLLEILSTTPDLVAIADANSGRLLYLNASGRKMLAIGALDEISELRLGDFHADAETDLAQQEQITWAKHYGNWVGESAFVNRAGGRVTVSKQILGHRSPEGGDKLPLDRSARYYRAVGGGTNFARERETVSGLDRVARRWGVAGGRCPTVYFCKSSGRRNSGRTNWKPSGPVYSGVLE